MSLYAHRSWRLVGQVGSDLFMLAWLIAWWLIGRFTGAAIRALAAPARKAASSAAELSGSFGSAASGVDQVPGLGSTLREPFDQAVTSLNSIVAAAQDQVASIERLSNLIGWLVFLVPVSILLAIWLPARIRFVRRSRAAQQFIDGQADLDLFALRAMTSQPMHVLARISDDPVAAWRRGDQQVIDALAEVELRRNGLRLPTAIRGEDDSRVKERTS